VLHVLEYRAPRACMPVSGARSRNQLLAYHLPDGMLSHVDLPAATRARPTRS
jgi:hypothetical protein